MFGLLIIWLAVIAIVYAGERQGRKSRFSSDRRPQRIFDEDGYDQNGYDRDGCWKYAVNSDYMRRQRGEII